MIRVDLDNKVEGQNWGYTNKDGEIERVYVDESPLVSIGEEYNRESFSVYKEDLEHLIKALQEAKKFIDSNK